MSRSISHRTEIAPQTPAPSSAIEDETLTGRVTLDGGRFVRCRFVGAQLVFAGGTPPQISNCEFHQVRFEFEGPAANTLALLQAMSAPSSGLQAVFKSTFRRIFAH